MPRGKAKADVYVANQAFSCELDGVPVTVSKGEYVREGHALLSVYPDAFTNTRDVNVKWDMPEVEERMAEPTPAAPSRSQS